MSKRRLIIIFILAVTILLAVTVLIRLFQKLESHHHNIFTLQENHSWVEAKSALGGPSRGIIRTGFRIKDDIFLLSKDSYATFAAAFNMVSPNGSGIVYHYRDEDNFNYVYYSLKDRKIYWGKKRNASIVAHQDIPAIIRQEWPVEIISNDNQIKIFAGRQLLAAYDETGGPGRVGLISNLRQGQAVFFKNISIEGKDSDGEHKALKNISTFPADYVGLVLLLYVLLIGGVFWVEMFYLPINCKIDRCFCRLSVIDGFLLITGWILLYQFFIVADGIVPDYLFNVGLLKNMAVSLSGYAIVAAAAMALKRIMNGFSLAFISLGLLFGLYTLSLVLSLMVPVQLEATVMLLILIVLTLLGLRVKTVKTVKTEGLEERKVFINFPYLIAWLWILASVAYLLGMNLTPGRAAFVDEIHLWHSAAVNMAQEGYLKASIAAYPGGNMHSFAVPFISAWPVKIFGANFMQALFFMPLIIVFCFGNVLFRLADKKWGFLFFVLAILVVINRQNWFIELILASIYADGIFMALVLLMTAELMRIARADNVTSKTVLFFSFFCGAFALCKSSAFFVCLICVFCGNIIFWQKSIDNKIRRIWTVAGAIGLAVLPYGIWKIFIYAHHLPFHAFGLSGAGMSFNAPLMRQLWLALKASHMLSLIVACIAILFIVTGFKKRDFLVVIPIILYVGGFFAYYAYFYQGEDAVSGARYLTAVIPALFYLGGVGLDDMLKKTHARMINPA